MSRAQAWEECSNVNPFALTSTRIGGKATQYLMVASWATASLCFFPSSICVATPRKRTHTTKCSGLFGDFFQEPVLLTLDSWYQ